MMKYATKSLPLVLAVWLIVSIAASPSEAKFPGGVTPTHAYTSLDRLDRTVDALLAGRDIKTPASPPVEETKLGPLHVYQLMIACSNRVQEYNDQIGSPPLVTLVCSPRRYAPRDVRSTIQLMIDNLQQAGETLGVEGLPVDEQVFEGKTPTDVFRLGATVYVKLDLPMRPQIDLTESGLFGDSASRTRCPHDSSANRPRMPLSY